MPTAAKIFFLFCFCHHHHFSRRLNIISVLLYRVLSAFVVVGATPFDRWNTKHNIIMSTKKKRLDIHYRETHRELHLALYAVHKIFMRFHKISCCCSAASHDFFWLEWFQLPKFTLDGMISIVLSQMGWSFHPPIINWGAVADKSQTGICLQRLGIKVFA